MPEISPFEETYGVPVGQDSPASLSSIPYHDKLDLYRDLSSQPWPGGREWNLGYDRVSMHPGNIEMGGLEPLFNQPLDIDYDRLEEDTRANRRYVGWVGNDQGHYIPASTAYERGYFNDPNAPGKSYFETNPEFKTFFPFEPYYGGLDALDEWQKSGEGVYGSADLPQNYMGMYYPEEINDPNFWWGGDEINQRLNRAKKIAMNTGAGGLNRWDELYGNTTEGVRDTLLHEMLHHYMNIPGLGTEGGTLLEEYPEEDPQREAWLGDPWHAEIALGAPMWSDFSSDFTDEGLHSSDFQIMDQQMRLHRLAKKRYLEKKEGI